MHALDGGWFLPDVLSAYRRLRDPVRLEAEMARLDEAEQSARSGAEEEGLDPAESVDFLRNSPALWEEAPDSRLALAESLFDCGANAGSRPQGPRGGISC
jgi:hypothetical protein